MKASDNMVLHSVDSSNSFFRSKLMTAETEEFWVAALDSGCRVISATMLFKGTVNYCLFHPRDILRYAVLQNAVYIIVAHNHPSNLCLPSRRDIQHTRILFHLCQLIQIPLADHLIITNDEVYSFAQSTHFAKWKKEKNLSLLLSGE